MVNCAEYILFCLVLHIRINQIGSFVTQVDIDLEELIEYTIEENCEGADVEDPAEWCPAPAAWRVKLYRGCWHPPRNPSMYLCEKHFQNALVYGLMHKCGYGMSVLSFEPI